MITVNSQFTEMIRNPARKKPTLPWPVILYLACVVTPVRFMAGPLQMTGLRVFLLAMLPFVLIRMFRVKWIAPDILLLLFVAWVFVAMQVNTPGQALEHAGITLLEMFGGYALARVYVQTHDQFKSLIKAVLLLVLLCMPLAISETLTGDPLVVQLIRAIPGITSVDVVTIAPRLGLERVQAIFAHPIHFGLFCSSAISLVYIGLLQNMPHPTRMVASVLIVGTTFLALSSGAFISVLIQLFLIGWALVFAQVRHKWVWLLVACVVSYIFVDLVSNRTPLRVFFSYATFSAHNAYWRGLIFEWGMHNVWANPVFGLGFNDWVRPHFMNSGSMDNFWLVAAVRYGLPGFVLLTCAWVTGLIRVAKAPQSSLKTAWMFCMVGLTFTLCTVHVWTAVYSYVFFLFGAGQSLAVAAPAAAKSVPQKPAFRRPFQPEFTRAAS